VREESTKMQDTDDTFEFANQELIALMQSLAEEETLEKRAAFHQMLLDSQLLLPAPAPPATEDGELEEDIPLLTFEDDAGATVLVAFTDEEAALAWAPDDAEFVALRGLDLLLIAVQNRIDELVLNPGSINTRHLHREAFEAVALQGTFDHPEGRIHGPAAGTTVLIAPPDETPPVSWWRTMEEILSHYPSVETAYFFRLQMAPQGTRHVIGVELYAGMSLDAQERLMADLLEELENILPKGWTLDVVVLDERDFLTTVQDTVSPFYERE
jgi:hypothetical protein